MNESAVKIFYPGFRPAMGGRLLIVILAACSAVFSLHGCSGRQQIILGINGQEFRVEVADTPDERARGLMHRSHLGEDEGMLFVFPYDQKVSFWMKNTLIPLSVAYVAKDGTIKEIHHLTPLSEVPVPSMHSVRYALELNQGAFGRAGAAVGDKLEGLPLK